MDNFTYSDISGKRRLRNYVWAVIVIGIVVLGLFGYAAWQRSQVMAVVNAEPQPLDPTFISPTEVPTSLPPTATQEACPSNPDDWNLVDVIPNDNYKRIEPTCVYEGLERTVAWYMAIKSGYTVTEANQALGFSESPMEQFGLPKNDDGLYLNVLTNQKGPLAMNVVVEVPHPDFATWLFDENGDFSVTYHLRGCFGTSSISGGNTVSQWGNGYPVVCVVGADQTANQSYILLKLGNSLWANTDGDSISSRKFYYFGYKGDGLWNEIGFASGLTTDIVSSALRDEYKLFSQFYQTSTWNSEWLASTYGLTMRPLPESWQTYTDVSGRDEIVRLLGEWNTAEFEKYISSQGGMTP